MHTTHTTTQEAPMRTVYLQATTGLLHARQQCGITRRTRYNHFPVEFDARRQQHSPRCARCWDGYDPKAAR